LGSGLGPVRPLRRLGRGLGPVRPLRRLGAPVKGVGRARGLVEDTGGTT
jgi:hypothetical protein